MNEGTTITVYTSLWGRVLNVLTWPSKVLGISFVYGFLDLIVSLGLWTALGWGIFWFIRRKK